MYRKSTWFSVDRNVAIIKKYHAANCLPQTEKNRQRRKPKTEGTGWKQEQINFYQRTEKLQRVMLDNFHAGDYYLTLTYRTGHLPESEQQAKKDFEKFKRKLRDFYSREKLACKWIGVIENINNGKRVHMHVLVNALPAEKMPQLEKLWPHGRMKVEFYKGEAVDAFTVSGYFTKQTINKTAGAISTSRNLIRTEPKYETVKSADTFSDDYVSINGYERVEGGASHFRYTEAGYLVIVTVLQRKNPWHSPPGKKKGDK